MALAVRQSRMTAPPPMSQDSRTPERLRHHFEVERELAARLRASTREERPALFKALYDELFERVPDHPRLTRRDSAEASRRKAEGQMRLLGSFLRGDTTLVEFAPGDCRLAYLAAAAVKRVIGVDISDQRSEADRAAAPANFELCVYDGYNLGLPDAMADVVFSFQFLEHLHPDDVAPHFEMVRRLLKPGGWYVFDTPHRLSGPHDVSRHFGDELVCFHFQEWTFREMIALLGRFGFDPVRPVKKARCLGGVASAALLALESVLGWLPRGIARKLAARLFSTVSVAARAA